MPERYRAAFDGEAIREHAAIVARRAGPVHLEIWQRLADGGVVLCVVADDMPGLLSLLSASLVVHDIDIIAVKAYTRPRPETGRAEAVDFVWVKRAATPALPFAQVDLTGITDVLTALVSGEATVESVLRKDRLPREGPPSAPTSVSFDPSPDTGPALLTVKTIDRPGLHLAITQALFRAGVQIVASEATTRNGRAVDHFTLLERDGSPIGRPRRGTVRTEVLSSIEALVQIRSRTRSTGPPKPPAAPR
jgi:UTP:GlnB (protein PII) uridylyltransferase